MSVNQATFLDWVFRLFPSRQGPNLVLSGIYFLKIFQTGLLHFDLQALR